MIKIIKNKKKSYKYQKIEINKKSPKKCAFVHTRKKCFLVFKKFLINNENL
jgi:hypothetical protein